MIIPHQKELSCGTTAISQGMSPLRHTVGCAISQWWEHWFDRLCASSKYSFIYNSVPVTMGKFMTALNQLEVEHQKNADFLKNPYPAIEPNEFYKQASTAQKLAQDLSSWGSRGLPLAWKDLAHGQEVILYGTLHLHAAVMAWIEAIQEETYQQLSFLVDELPNVWDGEWSQWLPFNLSTTCFSGHFSLPLEFMPLWVPVVHMLTCSSWRCQICCSSGLCGVQQTATLTRHHFSKQNISLAYRGT